MAGASEQPRAGEHGKTTLHVAAEVDDAEEAERLIAAGANLEALTDWNHTPLEWAANMNSQAAASVLRRAGAKLSLFASAGLGLADEAAACFGLSDRWDGSETVRLVRPKDGHHERTTAPWHSADVVATAFHIAARNNHLDTARLLHSVGAPIDAPGMFNASALHWAAAQGHLEAVQWLVSEGADLQRRDEGYGATPLGWAREKNRDDVIRFLLGQGAS